MEHGFVVTAGKNGCWFFKSFHEREDVAEQAMRRTIDTDALRVVPATVTFDDNGNVRRWDMTPNY